MRGSRKASQARQARAATEGREGKETGKIRNEREETGYKLILRTLTSTFLSG
jgi:hypothetical protein